MKLVIIGNGPAAVKSLEAISTNWNAEKSEKLEITVISSERVKPYAPMFLLDYALGKRQKREIDLAISADHLPTNEILGKRVVAVETQKNKILLDDGGEVKYDKLLVASGASPIKPDIKGIEKKGVYFLNRLADAQKLLRIIKSVGKVIIIGGGTIGVEAAVAFREAGKKVTIVELAEHVLLPVFDKDICQYLEKKLDERGIDLVLGKTCSAITGDKEVREIVVGGKEVDGDIVLITAGVRPNIEFLKSSGVKVVRGIVVDDHMRTSIPNVFAAGDVVESRGQSDMYEPVFSWYSAIEQGWVAGCNIIGVKKTYRHCPALVSQRNLGFPAVAIGKKVQQDGYELLKYTDEKKGIFERIYIRDNCIDYYQTVGIPEKSGMMYEFIRSRRDISPIKDSLLYGKFSPVVLMN